MKRPVFSKELTKSTLTEEVFQSHEDYHGLRFESGHIEGKQAEYLVLQQIEFQGVRLDNSNLYAPKLTDVSLKECSLANINCERMIAHRTEFVGCRLLGLNLTEGHLQDVYFYECGIQLARFRFCSFKSVTFEGCNLKNANFQSADLSGYFYFKRCDLSNAELPHAKLVDTDFRTSTIKWIRVGAEEVIGAVVDHFQAAYLLYGEFAWIGKGEDEA